MDFVLTIDNPTLAYGNKSRSIWVASADGSKKAVLMSMSSEADQVGNVTTAPIEQVINEQTTAYRQQAQAEFEFGINGVAEARQQAEMAEQQQEQAEQTPAEEQPHEEVTEQQPETTEVVEEQPAEQVPEKAPSIPKDKDGNPIYEQSSPELAVQDIFNNQGLPADIATQFVANKLEEAKKLAEKLAKKEPKIGTNIARYKEAMIQWQQAVTQAQANVAFWQQVQSIANEATAEVAEETATEEQTPTAETEQTEQPQAETAEEQTEEETTEETAPEAEQTTEEVAEEAPVAETPQAEQPQAEETPAAETPVEEQPTAEEIVADTPDAQLATEAAIKALTDSGIEVVEATDEMAMAVLENIPDGFELMAVEEAKRRADAIEKLAPINIVGNTKSEIELKEEYKNLPSVEKDGKLIAFYNSAFKKIYKEGGLFAQVVPQLDEILNQSILAYSEADNLGGIIRPDGSTHKEHPNVTQFLNYVGKVDIKGKEYYVRTTVQEEKSGQTGTHAYMVTEVSLYENATAGLSLPITTRARGTFDGVVDTKLQQFFDYANGKLNNHEFHIVYHGSGAKFDAFDHGHIGEGEGNQAYGWGTYVTEVEEIGKSYASTNIQFQGLKHELARLKERLPFLKGQVREEAIAEIARLEEQTNGGNAHYLYSVEIPNDNGHNYLRHDKPVSSREIARVKQRLFDTLSQGDYKGAERELREELNGVFVSGLEGDVLYNTVSAYLGGDKPASIFFNEMGYVGIKYPSNYMSGGNTKGQSNYVIFNEADAKIVDRVEFLRTPQGTIYGWTDGKRIYLTREGMNPETPVHEYTHLWAKAMMQNNAKGWQSVKDLLRGTPAWNEVMNDANYRNIHSNEDAVASEVIARLSGKNGAQKMQEMAQRLINEGNPDAQTLIDRIRQALQDFWHWVGVSLFDIHEFESIDEITDRVLWDMVQGTDLSNLAPNQNELMIIGEQGATELDQAEVATIRMDNLNIAREMETAGKDAKAIRLATGWERGADGKWRYEIPDADIEATAFDAIKQGNAETTLEALLGKDNEIFKAYPDMRTMRVVFADLGKGNKGGVNWESRTIILNASMLHLAEEQKMLANIEKAQTQLDRANNGRNPRNNRPINSKAEQKEHIEFITDILDYQKEELDALRERTKAEVRSILSHEAQHSIQYLEGFAKGGTPSAFVADNQSAAYDKYHRLGGEVEARNAQTRLDYTDQQRREKLLAETEDVAREDQIFLMENSGVSAMAEDYTDEEQAIIDQAKANGTYLKAPNGKDTKLTPKQWAQVRTQAFKEWFGDWELVAMFTPLQTAKSVSEALNIISHLFGKPLTNKEFGFVATITKNKSGKLRSEKAVKQSKDARLHALAVANIDTLFENAELHIEYEDMKGIKEIEKVHRFGTLMYDSLTNEFVPIKITAFEYNDRSGNKIYSIEAVDIIKQKSAGLLEDDSKENPRSPLTDFDAKLIEYTDNANKSAQKISKVVDENGEPLVVYHGTKAEFTVFDASHNHKANKGFFFSDSENMAKSYGKTKAVFLNIRDAYEVNGEGRNWNDLFASITHMLPVRAKYSSWRIAA